MAFDGMPGHLAIGLRTRALRAKRRQTMAELAGILQGLTEVLRNIQ